MGFRYFLSLFSRRRLLGSSVTPSMGPMGPTGPTGPEAQFAMTMAFEDADYAVLRGIVETPFVDQGGNVSLPRPLYQLQLQPFADAILGASTTDPSVATEN